VIAGAASGRRYRNVANAIVRHARSRLTKLLVARAANWEAALSSATADLSAQSAGGAVDSISLSGLLTTTARRAGFDLAAFWPKLRPLESDLARLTEPPKAN
jgi:hypothetical protein